MKNILNKIKDTKKIVLNNIYVVFVAFVLLLAPISAFAQTKTTSGSTCISSPKTIADLITYLICLVNNMIIPLIITLMVVLFLWGIFKYFFQSDDKNAKKDGQEFIKWGLIAITIVFTVWGFVGFIKRSFFGNSPVSIPQLEETK